MESVWSEVVEWERTCNVERDPQFGGSFDGNSSRRLLKNTDSLDAIIPLQFKHFVTAFKSLNRVVHSCFGTALDPDYIAHIDAFKQAYTDLNISITPKIHAIIHHIPQFCNSVGAGLGRFSEQASESVHYSFKTVWARFKVGRGHPAYASRLLRAVNVYNTGHI